MKITKSQLKRLVKEEVAKANRPKANYVKQEKTLLETRIAKIVAEERRKLINEGLPERPISSALRSNLDDAIYDFQRNLESALGIEDSRWYENANVLMLINEKLDELKSNYRV